MNIQGKQNNYLSNLSMAPIPEVKNNNRTDSKGYNDNQLSSFIPKSNPNINFTNNLNNNNNSGTFQKSLTKTDFPAFSRFATSFYGQSMHPNPQGVQSGMPTNNNMMGFPLQPNMMQNPHFGAGIPGFLNNQQNFEAQGNVLKTLTYNGKSRQLLINEK